MGTGGTLPSNRTQSVTFYNTAGIIEKHKNIYFVPRFSSYIGRTKYINQEYLTAFNNKCLSSTKQNYKNIGISQWSPEDRSLVIKGNIDDFRVVTSEGDAYNYFIVTRVITKGNSTTIHYYAFFINNVEQVGGGSIRLDYEPDYFTNKFYLHNTQPLATDGVYNTFNNYMKNVYVERQHYDRVGLYGGDYSITISDESGIRPDVAKCYIEIMDGHTSYFSDFAEIRRFYDTNKIELFIPDYAIPLESGYLINVFDYASQSLLLYTFEVGTYTMVKEWRPDNLDIFVHSEEDFKYRYQYRDFKSPLTTQMEYLTNEEINTINNASSVSDLSSALRLKYYKECLSWCVVTMRDSHYLTSGRQSAYINHPTLNTQNINSSEKSGFKNGGVLQVNQIYFPIFNVASQLKKLNNMKIILRPTQDIGFTADYDATNKTEDLLINLFNKGYGEYIESVQIIKNSYYTQYVSLVNNDLVIVFSDFLGRTNNYNANLLNCVGLSQSPREYAEIVYTGGAYWSKYGNNDSDRDGVCLGLCLGKNEQISNLKLKYDIKNVQENYFDNILNFEPYTFYSLSWLGTVEQPINRKKFYTDSFDYINYQIEYKLILNNISTTTEQLLPYFNLNGYKFASYNDAMSLVVSDSLPIDEDSYYTYLNNNKTQMKNQFAVNNASQGANFANSILGGYGSVASGAIQGSMSTMSYGGVLSGGETGALLGGISGFANVIKSAITWGTSNAIIGMNQRAKLADMGAMPDNLRITGTSAIQMLRTGEIGIYLNHYSLDELSYNSICKYLERYGYVVNIYDTLHTFTRKGWDYVKTIDFEFNEQQVVLTIPEEEAIRRIFSEGVTLLHDESYFIAGHNYEVILD